MSNLGDAIITKILLDNLKNCFPTSTITVFTGRPKSDESFFSKYHNVHPDLYTVEHNVKSKKILAIQFFFNTILYFIWIKFQKFPINSAGKNYFSLIKKSNLIIFAGGGYLGGNYNPLPFILKIILSKKIGKKIYLSGITVEPQNGYLSKILLRYALNMVDMITVREPISEIVLKKMKVTSKVLITSDYGFLLQSDKNFDNFIKEILMNNTNIKIGINLMDTNTLQSIRKLEDVKSYETGMIDSIMTILQEINCIIFLIPFQKDDTVNDSRIYELIEDKLQEQFPNRVFMISDKYSPEQIKGIMSFMDFFIGTRFHSILLSLSNSIPTIAINYKQKNLGLMKMYDLNDYLIDFCVKSETLMKKLKQLMENKSYLKNKISEKTKILSFKANQNLDLIHNLIEYEDKFER
jgi:colanic acid/amylovoran biosynthesis protein